LARLSLGLACVKTLQGLRYSRHQEGCRPQP
jgi:hypothetical protein